MAECIFCNIINGSLPADIVYEDARVVAFRDVQPQAPVHLLLVPRLHLETIGDLMKKDPALAGHLLTVATNLAGKLGIDESGFRIVANCRDDGGQTVYHVHFHLLGGRRMTWPPG
jgi:histidine triad (HIT) family protein